MAKESSADGHASPSPSTSGPRATATTRRRWSRVISTDGVVWHGRPVQTTRASTRRVRVSPPPDRRREHPGEPAPRPQARAGGTRAVPRARRRLPVRAGRRRLSPEDRRWAPRHPGIRSAVPARPARPRRPRSEADETPCADGRAAAFPCAARLSARLIVGPRQRAARTVSCGASEVPDHDQAGVAWPERVGGVLLEALVARRLVEPSGRGVLG
jgi:hypothetical protein